MERVLFGFFLYLLIELVDKREQGWGVYGRMDGRTTDTFWPVLTHTHANQNQRKAGTYGVYGVFDQLHCLFSILFEAFSSSKERNTHPKN